MLIPFLLLMLILGATPATLFLDGPVERGIAAAATALAAAAVAILVRPGEGAHLVKLIRPWLAVAAAPALVMLVQALPLPGLAHPIWASAADALGTPMVGAISIDPAMTLIGLGSYLSAVMLVFVAMAVTIERQRAEAALLVLVAITAVMSVISIAAELGAFAVPGADHGAAALHALGALGVILAAAATIHGVERLEMQRERNGAAAANSVATVAACLIALAICGVAVVLWSPAAIVFATACGLGVLAAIVVARRFGAAPRLTLAFTALGLIAVLSVAMSIAGGGADATLRFAIAGPTDVVSRMLADIPWFGSGAGTFSALLPIYAGVDDFTTAAMAPTAAAAIAVEIGRPMMSIAVLIAVAIAIVLLRGAMLRGRDLIYPAAAASCVVLMAIEAFVDATLLDATVLTIASAVIGLGLAQTVSRTAG